VEEESPHIDPSTNHLLRDIVCYNSIPVAIIIWNVVVDFRSLTALRVWSREHSGDIESDVNFLSHLVEMGFQFFHCFQEIRPLFVDRCKGFP